MHVHKLIHKCTHLKAQPPSCHTRSPSHLQHRAACQCVKWAGKEQKQEEEKRLKTNSSKSPKNGQIASRRKTLSPCRNANTPENDQCGHFWVNSSSCRLYNWLIASPSGDAQGLRAGRRPNCGDSPYALGKENDTSSLDICIQTLMCTCKHAYQGLLRPERCQAVINLFLLQENAFLPVT